MIEFNLRIAGARTEAAHDDSAATFLASEDFGYGVDFVSAEPDNGRALRQLRNLLLPCIREGREPLAHICSEVEVQVSQDIAHSFCAEQERFLRAARIEDTVCENMSAVIVFGELNFINRQKLDRNVGRHGFYCADPIARFVGDDPLFACHQSDGAVPFCGYDTVIDFAREQAQRQSDHAGCVAHHTLQRIMRLPGIGRA